MVEEEAARNTDRSSRAGKGPLSLILGMMADSSGESEDRGTGRRVVLQHTLCEALAMFLSFQFTEQVRHATGVQQELVLAYLGVLESLSRCQIVHPSLYSPETVAGAVDGVGSRITEVCFGELPTHSQEIEDSLQGTLAWRPRPAIPGESPFSADPLLVSRPSVLWRLPPSNPGNAVVAEEEWKGASAALRSLVHKTEPGRDPEPGRRRRQQESLTTLSPEEVLRNLKPRLWQRRETVIRESDSFADQVIRVLR